MKKHVQSPLSNSRKDSVFCVSLSIRNSILRVLHTGWYWRLYPTICLTHFIESTLLTLLSNSAKWEVKITILMAFTTCSLNIQG